MVFKGEITRIFGYHLDELTPEQIIEYRNKAEVRVDWLQNADQPEILLVCTFCLTPGSLNSYKEGDFVFVSFEENSAQHPVILGKFYRGYEEEVFDTRGSMYLSSLKVKGSASLPYNTTIGDITPEQLKTAVNNALQLRDIFGTGLFNIEFQEADASSGASVGGLIGVCKSILENLYEYDLSTEGYGSINSGNYYTITKDGSPHLTEIDIRHYMECMTGSKSYPIVDDNTKFQGAFLLTNGIICYPTVVEDELHIMKVTTESFITRSELERILEELSTPISMTDVSTSTTQHTGGIGLAYHDTQTDETTSSAKVNIIDIERPENEEEQGD